MNTKTMLTITAMVFAVGISGIVMGLPSIPQVEADSQDRAAGKYGSCNGGRNGFDQWQLDLSGNEKAEDRKAFCGFAKP